MRIWDQMIRKYNVKYWSFWAIHIKCYNKYFSPNSDQNSIAQVLLQNKFLKAFHTLGRYLLCYMSVYVYHKMHKNCQRNLFNVVLLYNSLTQTVKIIQKWKKNLHYLSAKKLYHQEKQCHIPLHNTHDLILMRSLLHFAAATHHDYPPEGSGVRSAHCSSEPRLTDNDASPGLRRRGSRRGQSVHHAHHRKVNAYLDVPDANSPPVQRDDLLDEDLYRLRSFSLTSKGERLVVVVVVAWEFGNFFFFFL